MTDKNQKEIKALELQQQIRELCKAAGADYAIAIVHNISETEDGPQHCYTEAVKVTTPGQLELLFESLTRIVHKLSNGEADITGSYIKGMQREGKLHTVISDQQDDALALNEKIDVLTEQHKTQGETIKAYQNERDQLKEQRQRDQEVIDGLKKRVDELIRQREPL